MTRRDHQRATAVAIVVAVAAAAIAAFTNPAAAQAAPGPTPPPAVSQSSESDNVEQVVDEAARTPEAPLYPLDRPLYRALRDWKRELNEKHGINWALEDTLIYQAASGGVDPRDSMVNNLGLLATWKIFRDDANAGGKNFAGLGFQAETRGNPLGDGEEFTDMVADLGTLWSPNDSTSDDYSKINQLWWAQRFWDGRAGYMIGKIDPGAYINGNRFAGSGNSQFFAQPFATNPARSFPDNGLGFILRADPSELSYAHFVMSDSDAVSTGSPFTTFDGHWFYAGEVGLKPKLERLGQGTYRLMLYYRDAESADEIGWSFSADQNLGDDLGLFLRYGGNDQGLSSIRHLLAGGVSLLRPFGRPNDQAGLGLAWAHPADGDFRDEYSTEVFYRLRVTEGLEISASAQLILDPSANADRDAAGVFGVRVRLLY